eukprot:TRINITY_DN7881_c0_g1_i7.p1 TRINITY_DN7881_c0_g1~~TRINITY_DN7881_c0_g1_i7.p1  ORF type:complete len:134 (-),score=26.36 TRINITY_DN7881_c0_g1_i7:47-448(-)
MDEMNACIKIASSLYYVDENNNKQMLSCAIQSHDIWHKLEFWQRMLKEGINLELKLQRSRILRKGIQSAGKPEGAQLSTILLQMMRFKVEVKHIQRFAHVNTKIHGIAGPQLENIEVTSVSYTHLTLPTICSV